MKNRRGLMVDKEGVFPAHNQRFGDMVEDTYQKEGKGWETGFFYKKWDENTITKYDPALSAVVILILRYQFCVVDSVLSIFLDSPFRLRYVQSSFVCQMKTHERERERERVLPGVGIRRLTLQNHLSRIMFVSLPGRSMYCTGRAATFLSML